MSRRPNIGPRHIDNQALTIWRLLLKEGGYWRVCEITDALQVDAARNSIRRTLDRLGLNGMVRMRQAPGRHPGFGVTPACTAPPGYGWMLETALTATGVIDWAALELEHA